ncbi:MAG: Mur ligase family protein [Gemmatimonadaceae bacterium]
MPMKLSVLARATAGELIGGDAEIYGISMDSRTIEAGQLFVAIPGARFDAVTFAREAVRRGAAGVCAVTPVSGAPTLVVPEPRCAIAKLAAAFHGHPAREMLVIGITGSLGKTSTALLVEAALAEAGIRAGLIGSLGIRYGATVAVTGMTTPDAPAIHGALRAMLDRDIRSVVMEVTSHAILHERVRGIRFALGVITNLVPDEHLEFHPTPDDYVRTKARFFGMLADDAPLVLNADDPAVRRVVAPLAHPLVRVTAGNASGADVVVDAPRMGPMGSRFTLRFTREIPRVKGAPLALDALPIALPLLGRQQVANASLAATAALVAGAAPEAVAAALARAPVIPRRMQLIAGAGPTIVDDTVGNPASIHAVFEAVEAIPHARVCAAYAIRGARGVAINRHNAAALATCVARTAASLTVTASEDAADARNRVTDEERAAVTDTLRDAGLDYRYEGTLAAALRRTLAGWTPGDLVLLLGAQGMDRGAEVARAILDDGST